MGKVMGIASKALAGKAENTFDEFTVDEITYDECNKATNKSNHNR